MTARSTWKEAGNLITDLKPNVMEDKMFIDISRGISYNFRNNSFICNMERSTYNLPLAKFISKSVLCS